MADRTESKRLGTGLALFGEVVITGVVIALLSVPLVTALPALAAGTAHLRRHLTGHSVRVADLLRDFAAAWRDLWRAALALSGVALVLLWNLSLAQAGVMPGSAAVLAATTGLLAAWAVLLLRAAATWRPGQDWAGTVREAGRRAVDDLPGSLLLAVACGMCAVFVWMLLPLVLLNGGLLCLAAVAVSLRGAPGGEGPETD